MLTIHIPLITVPINSTVIAHAGDGNFHTVILFDPNLEEHRREAERLNQFMVYTALSMEGMYSNLQRTYNIFFSSG
jgi:FAD/FMN-containing dehydrogenase